jgi:hypothetical protein
MNEMKLGGISRRWGIGRACRDVWVEGIMIGGIIEAGSLQLATKTVRSTRRHLEALDWRPSRTYSYFFQVSECYLKAIAWPYEQSQIDLGHAEGGGLNLRLCLGLGSRKDSPTSIEYLLLLHVVFFRIIPMLYGTLALLSQLPVCCSRGPPDPEQV